MGRPALKCPTAEVKFAVRPCGDLSTPVLRSTFSCGSLNLNTSQLSPTPPSVTYMSLITVAPKSPKSQAYAPYPPYVQTGPRGYIPRVTKWKNKWNCLVLTVAEEGKPYVRYATAPAPGAALVRRRQDQGPCSGTRGSSSLVQVTNRGLLTAALPAAAAFSAAFCSARPSGPLPLLLLERYSF